MQETVPFRLFVVIVLHLLCASFLNAQKYDVNLRHWGGEDGLLHRKVNVVFEDRDGFIWLGSKRGLQRFDGHEFVDWTNSSTNGLLDNVNLIAQGADNQIWTGIWTIINPLTGTTQEDIEWFGHEHPTLSFANNRGWIPKNYKSFFINSRKEPVFLANLPTRLVIQEKGRTFRKYPFPSLTDSLPELRFIDKNDLLWIKGDGQQADLLHTDTLGNIIGSFLFPGSNNIQQFTNGDQGVYCLVDYDTGDSRYYLIKDHHEPLLISNLGENERIFHGNRLFWRIDHERFRGYSSPTATTPSVVISKEDYPEELFHSSNDFFADRKGFLWVYGQFGLFQLEVKYNSFTRYGNQPKPTNMRAVRSLTSQGNNIFGVNDQGDVILYQMGSEQPLTRICQEATAIFTGQSGQLFIATKGKILQYTTKKGLSLLATFEPKELGKIFCFHEDLEGRQWFGGKEGLAVREVGASKLLFIPPGPEVFLSGTNFRDIYQIAPGHNGDLWLNTKLDIYRFNPDSLRYTERYGKDEDKGSFFLPAERFYAFHTDTDGITWLATDGGLIRWDLSQKRYRLFSNNDGLPNGHIYGIQEDSAGNLWLSSDNGIVQFNKVTYQSRTLSERDGLSHREFLPGATHRSEDGTFLFGSANGIIGLQPEDFALSDQSDIANLVVSSYELFDGKKDELVLKTEELTNTHTLVFRPGDGYFRIKFALLEFTAPRDIQYAYRFGDGEWNHQQSNVLQVSQPAYGTYPLEIKAQGSDGTWTKENLRISMKIIRPFYFRPWFIIGAILALFGGVWWYFRQRTIQLKRNQVQLEQTILEATHQIEEDKAVIEEQSKELRKLDQLKSRFFANVSHELRTPLALMLGPIRRLRNKRKDVDKEEGELLGFLERNTLHLRGLVNEILDLSKLENNKLELQEEPTPLWAYLKRHLSHFYSIGLSESIQVIGNIEIDEDLVLQIDQKKFEKVINNFISNAIKFTSRAGRVTVAAREDGDTVLISVEDNGRGISKEDLPFVFDRFFQSKDKDAPAEGGTGIGLSMSKELAELMGGKVWAKSTLREGSTFYFQFPKRVSEEAVAVPLVVEEFAGGAGAEEDFKERGPSISIAGKHILIVEDNADLRGYYQILLSDYKLDLAENGQQALDFLSANKLPDLIISDLMMPVMDGMQLLGHLKADDRYCHLPVIMLTAKTNQQVKIKALRFGIDDYLNKPFDDDELLVRIGNLLRRQADRQAFVEEEGQTTNGLQFSASELSWLQEVEAYILKELDTPELSVRQISKAFSVSESTLLRQIKKLTGLTPNKYLQELRLNQAKELILSNKYQSVAEVAYLVGFGDPTAFSRSFRKRFGKAPTQIGR